MTLAVRIEPQTPILKMTVSGEETLRDSKRLTETMQAKCLTHGCDLILVDINGVALRPGTSNNYELAQYLSQKPFSSFARRLAFVHGPERSFSANFFEEACQNRGVNVRAFLNADDAIKWLTE
jgi:hypothetical protein